MPVSASVGVLVGAAVDVGGGGGVVGFCVVLLDLGAPPTIWVRPPPAPASMRSVPFSM